MTYTFPCTDCGVVTPTKLRKPKRCAPCAKAEALDYSRWNYRAHRDELLAYHRERYARNRESILARPEAGEEGVVTKDDLERDPTACRRSWRRRTDPCSTSATAARGWR